MSDLSREEIIRGLVQRHVVDAPESLVVALSALSFDAPVSGHNHPPPDPEALIDVAGLPAMLAENYPALTERRAELQAMLYDWQREHTKAGTRDTLEIGDDADLGAASDMLAQIDTFTKDRDGEVEAARQRVKRAPYDACKAIDGYFGGLRAQLLEGKDRVVAAQRAYLRAKAAREEIERQQEADRLRREAEAAIAAAAKPTASDEEFTDALVAEETAKEAEVIAAAPAHRAVGVHSALGTHTGLRSNWTYRVTDIKALAIAVAKGEQPGNFLAVNDGVVKAMVRAKVSPLRQCPGLEIYDDQQVARRGA